MTDMKKVYDDLIIINLYLGYILDLDFIGLLKWTNLGNDDWLQRSLT